MFVSGGGKSERGGQGQEEKGRGKEREREREKELKNRIIVHIEY